MSRKIYIIILSLTVLLFIGCQSRKSSENNISSFSFQLMEADLQAVIEENEINISVPYGTDITKLTPVVTIPEKAVIDPQSGGEMDFINPVFFTVTAEDGTISEYKVIVTIMPNTEKAMEAFVFINAEYDSIEIMDGEITAVVKYGTNIRELIPSITVSREATVYPAGDQVIDFTEPVAFTVTAADGTTAEYTFNLVIAPNTEKNIVDFSLDILNSKVVMEGEEIIVTVPYGTNVKALIPIIVISDNASISPESGEGKDLSSPVEYVVTAEDGSTKAYTVKVNVAPKPKSSENKILKFTVFVDFKPYEGVIDCNSITVNVPLGTDVKKLMASVKYSSKAKINPMNYSGVNFSKPVTYTVTAEDGSVRKYTITVVVPEPVRHVSGQQAIKKEFEKLGFVFDGSTAVYKKDDIEIFLVYEDNVWQLATRVWDRSVEMIFYQGMTIILGRDLAWSSMIYIDYALARPNSVHSTSHIRAFVQDATLFVHVFEPT